MTKKSRNYLFYLEDMLDSMLRIQEYIEDLSFNEFKASNLKTDAVIRNLEIIGEASKNVPDRIKTKYPELPWKQMYGLRKFCSPRIFRD
ncbi:MAG: HepT-like ribonuclease domain-containing protein [Balneolales bacterium]